MSEKVTSSYKHTQSLFLQCCPIAQIVPLIQRLDGWPSIETQEQFFSSAIISSIHSHPPSKQWLKSILNQLEEHIIDIEQEEVCDSLVELIIWNCARSDEDEQSYRVYPIKPSSTIIIKSYRAHNQVGTRIWEAGLYLMDIFSHILNMEDLAINILELGAGVGITGIAMKRILPNSKVIMTDFSADVLELLDENIDLNYQGHQSKDVMGRMLDWRMIEDCAIDMILDIIIAADCTYSTDTNAPLVHTIRHLLRRKDNMKTSCLRFSNGLELRYPCALVACTMRNQETYAHFLNCLSEEAACLVVDDITHSCFALTRDSMLYYENKDRIKLLYITTN
jgi:hypothetical protein